MKIDNKFLGRALIIALGILLLVQMVPFARHLLG